MQLHVDAVILAGGMSRRMGGDDKGLIELSSKPMITHIIDRIAPQVNRIMISANRNLPRYTDLGYCVFKDDHLGYLGPLAGMITAMGKTKAAYLLVVPCDCPLLPLDLVERMLTQIKNQNAELAVASDGQREQPTIMLLKPSLRESMKEYLDSGGRKVSLWYDNHHYVVTQFTEQPNAFMNVNTPEQKQQVAKEIIK
ncbi:molybdenum cofactor guanylyltransferase [Shewanella sp. VB17]|uniref:molybdenum cofactor guanylyltransferase MobA n=1 Tax=Shewanella sp. VB17 TaxID=2739432 RepID=UPI001564DCC5|nr:molybdenum cofactor guanylyltransferase MobA [Shewanella sp. VB17]NRD72070.1 molybdenum cofactor guanylyltransferase [Shewanella sp. VB17]